MCTHTLRIRKSIFVIRIKNLVPFGNEKISQIQSLQSENRRKMGNDNGNESQFGFKDKTKAEETIKLLSQHELQYQKLTVRGLLGRAKRVLTRK